MISDAVVGPVVRADLLIDVAVADLVPLELALLRGLLLLEHRIHPLLQFIKGTRFVRVLVPLVLAGGDSTRGDVSRTDC